jgi:hypothetical protein
MDFLDLNYRLNWTDPFDQPWFPFVYPFKFKHKDVQVVLALTIHDFSGTRNLAKLPTKFHLWHHAMSMPHLRRQIFAGLSSTMEINLFSLLFWSFIGLH